MSEGVNEENERKRGKHLQPMRLDGAGGQSNKMKKACQQMQSAFAINRRRSVDRTSNTAAATCITDLTLTHAYDATVAVAAAFRSCCGSNYRLGSGGKKNRP